MRTLKRTPNEIDTNLSKYSKIVKYFNQLEWKGIVENKNIFDVNQYSQADAKNVYVDSHGTLVSRKPLVDDPLTLEILPDEYKLKDMVTYGKYTLYVTLDTEDKYRITIDGTEELTLEGLTQYHICTIGHYIICFNDLGAKLLDTNNMEVGWQNFADFAEIPITKRVVGSQITEYDKNEFTTKYKEQYIWSNASQPILPEGDAEIIVNTERGQYKWTIPNTDILTDYRIVKPLNHKFETDDLFSTARGIICVGRSEYVLISYDGGDTFSRQWYPVHGSFLKIASISDDGYYYFFVATDAVYRLNLSDSSWTVIYVHGESDKQIGSNYERRSKVWHFLTGDVYAFVLYNISANCPVLWYQGPFVLGDDEFRYTDYGDYGIVVNPKFIDEKYRGTLGCSYTMANRNEAEDGWQDTKVWNDTTPTFVRIMVDHGVVYTNYVDNKKEDKDYATIFLTMPVDNKYGRCVETYAMPGSYCAGQKQDDGSIKSLPLSIVPSIYLTGSIQYQIGVGQRNSARSNQGIDLKTYTPKYIRVETVENALSWSIGGAISDADSTIVKGQERQTINDKYPGGIYTWKGKIYFEDLVANTDNSELNGGGWYDFVYQVGYAKSQYSDSIPQSTAYIELTHKLNVDDTTGAPIALTGGWICGLNVYNSDGTIKSRLPEELVDAKETWAFGDYFYIQARKEGETEFDTVYTNQLGANDSAELTYTYAPDGENELYTDIPELSYSDTELYLAFDKWLKITANAYNGTDISFNLPPINNQSFIDEITGMINISTTEVAIFFEDNIIVCSKVEDENIGYRYDYYPTKLSTGVRKGDSIINTLEGSYTIFPTKRGLAFMNYQAFMATTDQVLTYITDDIEDRYDEFYAKSETIKIIQMRERIYLTNGTKTILLYNLDKTQWWHWEVPVKITKLLTDQLELRLIADKLCIFQEHATYKDFPLTVNETRIEWFIMSQPLHMKAPNYYKNLKQLVFQLLGDEGDNRQHSITVQIQCYRKKLATKEPEIIAFKIEELRTFVKRFNYWKINEVQYALADDLDTKIPTRLKLNGMSVKYELGEEVR